MRANAAAVSFEFVTIWVCSRFVRSRLTVNARASTKPSFHPKPRPFENMIPPRHERMDEIVIPQRMATLRSAVKIRRAPTAMPKLKRMPRRDGWMVGVQKALP